MSRMKKRRPDPSEHAPYFSRYIDLVPENDIVAALQSQSAETQKLLGAIDESRAGYRYEPGKWSIRQVIGHIEDSERVFAYRALAFARGEKNPLPGFDEKVWMENSPFDSSTLRQRVESLGAVRRSTLELFRALDEEAWERRGIANDNTISVLALAYTVVGHERHHLRVLRDRYAIAT
jgi:DinB family protein